MIEIGEILAEAISIAPISLQQRLSMPLHGMHINPLQILKTSQKKRIFHFPCSECII